VLHTKVPHVVGELLLYHLLLTHCDGAMADTGGAATRVLGEEESGVTVTVRGWAQLKKQWMSSYRTDMADVRTGLLRLFGAELGDFKRPQYPMQYRRSRWRIEVSGLLRYEHIKVG